MKSNLLVVLTGMIIALAILLSGGIYETIVISKFQGETTGATIRYIRTNKITGSVSYCYLNSFDDVNHKGNCTQPK